METLLEVGRQLDRDIYPEVLDGGIVMPNNADISLKEWAKEKEAFDEAAERQRRSEARSRSRTTRRKRPSDQTPPLVCPELKARYESELPDVLSAYPHTQYWKQEGGLWLLTESALYPGSRAKAVFLAGIPYAQSRIVRAWGFWAGPPLAYPEWIGPRHTNFGDGSVCAFEPGDGTWSTGESIVTLLDLYSLWAVRQLHLRLVGRWPGRQVAHFPYERFLELRGDELCGCGSSSHYSTCCQENDLSRDIITDALDFFTRTGKERTPPNQVKDFIQSAGVVPKIEDLLPVHRVSIHPVYGLDKLTGPVHFYTSLD